MTTVARAKERLESRLRTLELRLPELERTLREPEDSDPEESAPEWDDDEVVAQLASAGRTEVELIRAALGRIDRGEYGRCGSCGRAISPERLTALPEADRCRRCAEGGSPAAGPRD